MSTRDHVKFRGFENDRPNLPPEQRNPGTGYVGFKPAENRKAARNRKGSSALKAKITK